MSRETTYTEARERFAELLDCVAEDREVIFVTRRGREKVAMVAADELSSLLETAHLLRSPRNAQRLLKALQRALKRAVRPQSVDSLRRELGIGQNE
jgi:antitoxin YefM